MRDLPQVGDLIDGLYEIREQLGVGGFGAVYLARHKTMDRDVALKLLVASGPSPQEMIERFRREVMATRVLSHPNTIRIFDFRDSPEGLLYYTMEYLRGDNIKDLLKREGAQSPRRVRHMARQVLKSLSEAHSHGIVHRDLKPANIMLVQMHGETDFVKVLDFGIAKVLDGHGSEDEELTSAGMLVGTLRYMAPEQITGAPLGPNTDLYSFGLIMIEMLTGQSVFAGTGRWEVMQRQVSLEPIALSPALAQTPLGAVIAKAVAKEPAARFPSADAMLAALDALPEASLATEALFAHERHSGPHAGISSSSVSLRPNAPPQPTPSSPIRPAPLVAPDAAPKFEAPPSFQRVASAPAPAIDAIDWLGSAPAPRARSKGPLLVALSAVALIGAGAIYGISHMMRADAAVASATLAPASVALATADVAPSTDTEEAPEPLLDEPVEDEPAAPESVAHSVTVTVTGPPSALVHRDGQLLGRAPQQVSFTERAEISVEAPGYTTRTMQLDPSSPATLALRLEPVARAAAPQPTREPSPKEARVGGSAATAAAAVVVPATKQPPAGEGQEADWVDVKPAAGAKAPKKTTPTVDVPIF